MKTLKSLVFQVASSSLGILMTSFSSPQTDIPIDDLDSKEIRLRDSDSGRQKPQLILKPNKSAADGYIIAGHRSHRSHSSHRSHYSSGGSGGRGGGSSVLGLVVGGLALYGAYSVFKDSGGKNNK